MSLFSKIRRTYHFKFKKRQFDIQGDSIHNMTYKSLNDTYLVTKAQEVAKNVGCRFDGFEDSDYILDGRIITIKATREEYIAFCSEFCEAMGDYIKNVQI